MIIPFLSLLYKYNKLFLRLLLLFYIMGNCCNWDNLLITDIGLPQTDQIVARDLPLEEA
jgi:hypothetical protein